jgi:hypothetical protein
MVHFFHKWRASSQGTTADDMPNLNQILNCPDIVTREFLQTSRFCGSIFKAQFGGRKTCKFRPSRTHKIVCRGPRDVHVFQPARAATDPTGILNNQENDHEQK